MPFGMKPPRQRWRLSLDNGDSICLSVLSRKKNPDEVCCLTYFDPEKVGVSCEARRGAASWAGLLLPVLNRKLKKV